MYDGKSETSQYLKGRKDNKIKPPPLKTCCCIIRKNLLVQEKLFRCWLQKKFGDELWCHEGCSIVTWVSKGQVMETTTSSKWVRLSVWALETTHWRKTCTALDHPPFLSINLLSINHAHWSSLLLMLSINNSKYYDFCIPPVYGSDHGCYLMYPRMGTDHHANRISTTVNKVHLLRNLKMAKLDI